MTDETVVELPDIPVPGTGVVLTNVTVTTEPLTPAEQLAFAALDAKVEEASATAPEDVQ